MELTTVTLHTTDGRTYKLPFGTTDSVDDWYITKVKTLTEQHERGLITSYEMLESLLLAHADWASV